jgi:hypothetical protein
MCRGTTQAGTPCRARAEPYCRHHHAQPVTCLKSQKAIRKLERGPSKTDGPGHIYVYYVDVDEPDTYYKIGRTAKGVSERLKQWKQSVLKKSYFVKNQKLAESLIHLELDAIRVYRYKLEDSYYTVWKNTNLPVDGKKPSEKLVATKKHIEWFKSDWQSIRTTIGDIVNLVNDSVRL